MERERMGKWEWDSIYGLCQECCENLKKIEETILDQKRSRGSLTTGVSLLQCILHTYLLHIFAPTPALLGRCEEDEVDLDEFE